MRWKIIFLSFLFSLVGGIFGSQILWPYLLKISLKPDYSYLSEPLIIFQNKKINEKNIKKILEDQKRRTIEEIKPFLVFIGNKELGKKNFNLAGLIISSDGFILTRANGLPAENNLVVASEEKIISSKIIKIDYTSNLALLKIEERNLKTPSFSSREIFLGQDLFIFTLREGAELLFQKGFVSSLKGEKIGINTIFKNNPSLFLFDTDGNFLAIASSDKEGNISLIPAEKIKDFLGF